MCSISAFGQTGPDAPRPGYGALAEARAGLYEMTGEPGGPPVSGPLPLADMMAASRAFGLICAALVARARTGRGDYLDVSLLDCAVELQDWAVERYVASGGRDRPTRRGQRDDALVPWGQFATADGWIVLIVSADRFWPGLADLIGQSQRPELATIAGRRAHRRNLRRRRGLGRDADLRRGPGLAARRRRPRPRTGRHRRRPAGRPQLHARGMFATLPSSAAARARPGHGLRLRHGSRRPRRPALGQHTAEVLAETEVRTESTARRTSSSEHSGPSAGAGHGPGMATFRKTLSGPTCCCSPACPRPAPGAHRRDVRRGPRRGRPRHHFVFLIGLMSMPSPSSIQRRGLSTPWPGCANCGSTPRPTQATPSAPKPG